MNDTEIIAIRQALTGIQVELIRIANALDTIINRERRTLRVSHVNDAL